MIYRWTIKMMPFVITVLTHHYLRWQNKDHFFFFYPTLLSYIQHFLTILSLQLLTLTLLPCILCNFFLPQKISALPPHSQLSPWIASLFPISVSWIPPVFSYLHVNMPSDFLVSVLSFPSYLPLSYFWRRLPFVFHACLWHLLTSPRHVSSGKFGCHLKCLSITLKTQGNFCKIKPSRDEGVKASSRGVSFSEFIVINQVFRQIRIDTSSSS